MFSSFGFALRHKIEFNPKTKQGTLLLWSRYDGFFAHQNPLVDGYGSSSDELFMLFGKLAIIYQANFPIGGINDLLSILSAIVSTRRGKEFSFLNYEDRMISFQPTKEGKQQVEVVTVKIRYSSNTGKLVAYEIGELESVVGNLLIDLGVTKQEITEKLESIITQDSNPAS